MKNVCIVIPSYNFNEMTSKCIGICLENAGMDVDIVVVDDGSKVPFADTRVAVVRLKENSGFTNAVNQGLLWCSDRYKYIHVLNNDTEPYPGFIKYLFDVAEKNPSFALLSSVRVATDNKTPVNNEGVKTGLELYGADLIRGYQIFVDTDLEQEYVKCVWVPLCTVMINALALRYIGLLDKSMRQYCSDNDICIRAKVLGYDVVLVPKSKVKHEREVTMKSLKAIPYVDQRIFLERISGLSYQRILNELPLDCEQKIWGKIDFSTYTKNGQK